MTARDLGCDPAAIAPLDGKLLSLALPMDALVLAHVPGPLFDRVVIDRYRKQMASLHAGILPPMPTLDVLRAQREATRARAGD